MPDPMTALQVRALRAPERDAAATLMAQVFGSDDDHRRDIQRRWRQDRPRHPRDDLNNYRAGFVIRNGREHLVSIAHVEPRTLRYGQAELRVTCIGSVCTHPDYRKQGYSAAVLRDTMAYAVEQGAHLALLRGIPRYYEQFGFTPVWPRYRLSAPAVDAQALPHTCELHAAQPDDLPRIAALYEKHWGTRVTFQRDPALWQWLYTTRDTPVIARENGTLTGYLWSNAKNPAQTEVVADTPDALAGLLAYAGDHAHRAGRKQLRWAVPPDDVIIPYAQTLLPMTLSAHYAPTGHWMARFIDSSRLLNALLPEIAAHARAMHPQFELEELRLLVEPDGVQLNMRNHPLTACYLSLRDFIQVLFGSLRPSTLALRQDLSRESVRLLEMLFPARVASIAAQDWF